MSTQKVYVCTAYESVKVLHLYVRCRKFNGIDAADAYLNTNDFRTQFRKVYSQQIIRDGLWLKSRVRERWSDADHIDFEST